MKTWVGNPSRILELVFRAISRDSMADLPICNPLLEVEAVSFRRLRNGNWMGAMVTPWAINLLCIPDGESVWPEPSADGKCRWSFPSGDYEFTAAHQEALGRYHLCSLFSPTMEFENHQAARLTAMAAVEAIFSTEQFLTIQSSI